MIYFKSKYFIRPTFLNWTVGIIVVSEFFLFQYISKDVRPIVETILTFNYVVLFLWATFYLLFKTYEEWNIGYQISELKEEKEKRLKYSDSFDKEELLTKYIKVHKEILDRNLYIHFTKTKQEVSNMSNINNYLMVLFILLVGQFSFDYSKPLGPILFIVLILASVIFCIRILIWEVLDKKGLVSPVTIGHALAIYLLFNWGRNSYIRSYGEEILGSYFEKPEYKAKYYVNMFSNDQSSKNYRLPADIHVFTATEDEETNEDHFGQTHTVTNSTKHITIDKVFWPNGGYLDFDNCQLELGDKVLCMDQEGRNWFIEITNEKVE